MDKEGGGDPEGRAFVEDAFREEERRDEEEAERGGYNWEQDLERPWELVREDKGQLVDEARENKRRRRLVVGEAKAHVRKMMIRNLVLIVDNSSAMGESDLKPSRKKLAHGCITEFIKEFFQLNPISQLSIVALQDRVAKIVTPLSANPEGQIRALEDFLQQNKHEGHPSLQNALQKVEALTASLPPYGTREALVVWGSLATIDPGNVLDSIAMAKRTNLRLSVVSMTPELYILKKMTKETGGSMSVALDREHFRAILLAHTAAPEWQPTLVKDALVPMGFPELKTNFSLCICHGRFVQSSFECPQCSARICEIPAKCAHCTLHLASSVDIGRGYHHLFPPEPFEPAGGEESDDLLYECGGCFQSFSGGAGRCPRCKTIFCGVCDDFIHREIHQCTGCLLPPASGGGPGHGADGGGTGASAVRGTAGAEGGRPLAAAGGGVTAKRGPAVGSSGGGQVLFASGGVRLERC
uniref:General transcription factor IIH subunit n=1 Tax=Chromera velia CCMP2878 TaxID=1169474 RepID=A0A0G4I5I8_9ALVE|eukprot:Cvel_11181.t1-p1 / transcript=Cvel_11181.t1 / gene=Cvel_11181 / organism=Chromera_velia_CCMP2878 / gene_product=General transcription factor IIH subunit 2, putative / transcript_product=General transcription factor IIH subunit 2, putative / location=Cvel_scaffold694:16156-23085(-) / protein_length=468 / sequence_SO=supercontig / SO=protein_coding / is_pseudo=false